MDSPKPRTKYRYNLDLPKNTYEALLVSAEKYSISAAEMLRRYIKLGVVLYKIQEEGGKVIIEEANGRVRELLIV